MLACGLSGPLVSALTAIAKHIPPLLKTLQGMFWNSLLIQIKRYDTAYLDRLLDLLSNLLSGQPYKPLGAPPNVGRSDVTAINRDLNSSQVRGGIAFFSSSNLASTCAD
jgi:serine/threonine-protein kinase mTOR